MTGIFIALSMVILLIASFIPGFELTVLALAGILVKIIINEINIRGGLLFFVATVLLGFLIIPNKSIFLIYAILFGPYVIIKSVIEAHIHSRIMEYILKLLGFNILLTGGIMLFQSTFFSGISLPDFAWYILAIGAQVMLILYDFILTYVVKLYEHFVPESIRGRRLF